MDTGTIGFAAAFAAGVLSFLSPCVFPLIPAYLAQLTGMSLEQLTSSQDSHQRRTLMTNAFSFVFGLALVFTAFGASATLLGRFLLGNQALVSRIAGLVIVLFGFHLLGVINIPWLLRESRLDMAGARGSAAGPAGSALMGAAFGVGWTPCIGPVLASILALASQAESVPAGMGLLFTYALGLGLPFMLVALALNRAAGLNAIKTVRRYMPQLNAASGALLLAMGLLVFTGNLAVLSNWITETFGTGLTI